MIKSTQKNQGNKKRVRYGPVRYVNLKFNEPVCTNTFQISELCRNCGTIRIGPNIDKGCQNCLVPRPKSLESLNKRDFLSRSNRSLEKLNNPYVLNENLNNKPIENPKIIKPCLKLSFEPISVQLNFDKTNWSEKNPDLKKDEPEENIQTQSLDQKNYKKLETKNEESLENFDENEFYKRQFKEKIKELESKLCFRQNVSGSEPSSTKSSISIKSTSSETKFNQANKNEEKFEVGNENRKRQNSKPEITAVAVNLDAQLSGNKKIQKLPILTPRTQIQNYSKSLHSEKENIENKTDIKHPLACSSTKSLESLNEKKVICHLPRKSRNLYKNNQIFGSNRSLERLSLHEIRVDNLNEVPQILGSLHKDNSISNKSLDKYNQDDIFIESPNEIPKMLDDIRINHQERNPSVRGKPLPIKPRRKVSNNSYRKCHNCEETLVPGEDAIVAEHVDSNVRWHPECFTCSKCEIILTNLVYRTRNQKIYCENHFDDYKICKACDQPIINDDCVSAENNYWHLEHFACCECKILLADQKYIVTDSKSYCLRCHQIKFKKKCESCKREILPTEVRFTYEKLNWHSDFDCFKCFVCNKDLTEDPFIIKKNHLFCSLECKKNVYKN